MPPPPRTRSAVAAAGTKRTLAALPDSNRDGTKQTPEGAPLRPAKKFAKYVEYNMSAMRDTRGGFLAAEDDPNNAAMRSADADALAGKPKNMSVKEWERLQLIRKLERQKQGPFEPGISVLQETTKICRECSSKDIDFVWEDVFKVCVCFACKEKFPDKYSLLTKTECREDYLLTDGKSPTTKPPRPYHYANPPVTQRNSETQTSSPTSTSPTRTNLTGTT